MRLLLEAGLVEQVLEPHALPARAAHGAIAPFHARHVRLEQAAAVAGALADRDQLDRRQLLQIIQTELDLVARAVPADGQLPGLGIHLGNIREMVANEECVVGRDIACADIRSAFRSSAAGRTSLMSGFLPGNVSSTASARVPSGNIGERLSATSASASVASNGGTAEPDAASIVPTPAASSRFRRVIITLSPSCGTCLFRSRACGTDQASTNSVEFDAKTLPH